MTTGDEELPEGRVAMLFTDIEGSTVHLRTLGKAYADVLSDQRRILRAAIASHDGHEMGTEGDSFFVVFPGPADAVAAAVDAQRALDANPWAGGARIRVRMGVHCGELTRHEEGYVGLELNRAARIASTANGGQIVVSADVRDGVAIDGVTYRDLGTHRLKDLPSPEPLFQLVVDGLPDIDTPIKSLGAPSNLPGFRAELVGRSDLVEELRALLSGPARLVTLTGPGGVGKTSLALAAAASLDRHFGGGVYFVALEGTADVDDAWALLAAALGVADATGEADVQAALDRGPCLLVLDNLEQLDGAARFVADIVDRTPASVLATSRGPLRLRAEQQLVVPPLDGSGAVELFVREAQRVRPGFDVRDEVDHGTIVAICERLDGLPLAVELVASRVRHLGLDAIARALDGRLDAASRDVDRPERHRTLTATVAWSYDLLEPEVQSSFRKLSVFAGGCTIDAAAAVVAGGDEGVAFDLVDALADVSLITLDDAPDGSTRLAMLGVVREFAASHLAGDENEDRGTRRAHAAFFADFAEEAERRLHGADQLWWSDRLALEHENLRAAFDWSATHGDARRFGVRIAAALGWFWYTHGRAAEGRAWLERAAVGTDDDDDDGDAALAARTLQALGVLQQQQGDNDRAATSFARALELSRAAGDDTAAARALNSLGVTRLAQERLDDARVHFDESIAIGRALGDEQRVASGLSNLGIVLLGLGSIDAAVASFKEALAVDRRRDDPWAVAVDETNLGAALIRRGDLATGLAFARSALPAARDLGDPDVLASAVEACALAAAIGGDARLAVALDAAAEHVRADASSPRNPVEVAFLERELGPARAEVGRAVVEELTAAARTWSAEQVVAVARDGALPAPSD